MQKATVKLFPKADTDLYEIWHYIAVVKGFPTNADRFIQMISMQFSILAATPNIGLKKDEYMKGALQFPFHNFLIFYRIEEDGIAIIRVLYGKRNTANFF